jgi:hypothetical protein
MNQTAAAFPVTDYVPQKQYPSFSTVVNEKTTLTSLTGAGVTLTAAQILGGIIIHDTSSGAVNDTLPTAALMIPAIEGAEVGSTVRFMIRNASAGAGTLTLLAGTGGTVTGTTSSSAIPYLQQEEFILRVTAIGAFPTYTVYGMGIQVF